MRTEDSGESEMMPSAELDAGTGGLGLAATNIPAGGLGGLLRRKFILDEPLHKDKVPKVTGTKNRVKPVRKLIQKTMQFHCSMP